MQSELKAQFDREGYAITRQFLPDTEFTDLLAALDRYISIIAPKLPAKHAFYDDAKRPETLKQLQHMHVDPFFRGYLLNRRWKTLAEELLGEEAVPTGCEWFNKPVGTSQATPAHQDNHYFNLAPPHVVTLWLALDDVDEENGCMRYLPGSHLDGRRPHRRSEVLGFSQEIADYGPRERATDRPALLQPNDLVAHHGWTIHRAEENRSTSRSRRSFAMVFRGISCQVDQEGLRRYEEGLTEQHRELGI